jgi:hypothetical protein
MAGPSNRQIDFEAILRDCDRARDLMARVLALCSGLDDLRIDLTEFGDKITRLRGYTEGHQGLSYLSEKLTELQATVEAFENISGLHYWETNSQALYSLREGGQEFEKQVRRRVQRQRAPDPTFLADMRDFIRDARRILVGIMGGSNAVHAAAMKKGSEILREEFDLFQHTLGRTLDEVSLSSSLSSPHCNSS